MQASHSRPTAGFTLIELMIVVAIVAILAAIAIPNYSAHIVRTRRADVQREMLQLAQALERYYTTNGRYVTTAGGSTCGVSIAYSAGAATYYGTTGSSCADNTFTITAVGLSGTSQANETTLSLDNTGKRVGTWTN